MRPLLLDLFCGAGGCSAGYARAGFEVVGVDREPHPDYPFDLIVGDAMTVLTTPRVLDAFDVIAASPPCQVWSTITPNRENHVDLLTPTLEILRSSGRHYIVENVPPARRVMRSPVKVCGSSFGLEVRRHRYFESDIPLMQLDCHHGRQGRPTGVYGDHPQDDKDYRRPDGTRRGSKAVDVEHARRAMDIDWMGWLDLAQAIPPAYTEFLGAQILDQMRAAA